MKLVVDSNIFIGGLDPKDALHQECLPVVERIVTGEIEALCPVLVLVETTCAFRRRTTVDLAFNVKEALARLPSILWLDINTDVAERACVLGIQTGLRGTDALVLQVAEQYGVPLVTMDREIRDKAPGGIFVLEPREVLARLS
jgi:predicted nucleic acid-binding protein